MIGELAVWIGHSTLLVTAEAAYSGQDFRLRTLESSLARVSRTLRLTNFPKLNWFGCIYS